MESENIFYTAQEIADLLGVSPASIQRWADSGKLNCVQTDEGQRKFTRSQLSEFAMTYNISMKFLEMKTIRSNNLEAKKITPLSVSR